MRSEPHNPHHSWNPFREGRIVSAAFGRIAAAIVLVALAAAIGPTQSFAQDAQTQAVDLSDHAFSMLNAINASSSKAGPILAPAASLAGDAQTLSSALSAHDDAGASNAMAEVLSDRDKIEAAAKIAGGQYPEQWTAIREKIAALEKVVPAKRGPVTRSEIPAEASAAHSSVSPPAGERMPDAPKIEVDSRVFKGEAVRVKGFLEGTDLKSAGIFDGDSKSKDIEVASVPGQQRINFDFTIEQPSPAQTIRVTDSYGREAQAQIEPNPGSIGAMKGNEEVIEVDSGAGSSHGEAGPLADSPIASAGPSSGHNTAEIPSSTDEASPSRRHIDAANGSLSPLNVQINVIDTEESMSTPGMVEVVGQIVGQGVRHAGVYVNGRLVKPIALSTTGYSAFDESFQMPAGSDARIRAYGNGENFVEASIDLVGGASGMTEYGSPPMYPNPYGGVPTSPYYRPNPNPYAYANPYANPYAAPGYNPYAPNPYGYGYPPPYGAPTPANVPWWQKMLR
jgi:hypothetical protein